MVERRTITAAGMTLIVANLLLVATASAGIFKSRAEQRVEIDTLESLTLQKLFGESDRAKRLC